MAASTVKDWFIERSGRTGLTDANAFFYMNAAQRELDMRAVHLRSTRSKDKSIVAADYTFTLTGVEELTQVWIVDSNSELKKLTFQSWDEFFANYPEQSTPTQGDPASWSIQPPDSDSDDGDTMTVWFAPASNGSYTLKCYGRFFTSDITADADTTVWTEKYPYVLLHATLMMDAMYGENESARLYWDNIVTNQLRTLLDSVVDVEDRFVQDNMELF